MIDILTSRMWFLWILANACLLLLGNHTSAELYSAMAGLETLLDTQRAIIGTLEHHIAESRKRVKELEKMKEEYDHLLNISSPYFQDFVSNPVNAFVLMKRLSVDWNETKKSIYDAPGNGSEYGSAVYPDYDDLSGAAKALLRVQQTYGLDTAALSAGFIVGAPRGLSLTADDCYEMGRQAFQAGYYEYAISWLEEARTKALEKNEELGDGYDLSKYLKIYSIEKGRQSIMLFTSSLLQLVPSDFHLFPELKNWIADQSNIKAHLTTMAATFFEEAIGNLVHRYDKCLILHGDYVEKQPYLYITFGYIMSPFVENLSTSYPLEDVDSNTLFSTQTNIFDEAIYRKLCQSKNDASAVVQTPRLKCRLVNQHPFLKLQPVKEEVLWKDPKISLFYDVISDGEIEIMKSLALPMLQRAEVAEYTGHLGHRVSDTRVTKIVELASTSSREECGSLAWLGEDDHPLIPQMYRRIEDITGLSSSSAEPFQMANYGLGGHFHLHMDVLPDTEKYFGPNMGNRIATWLIYMSDVKGGGATVFPRLNLTVWPKKGSALFWHNVKSNGVGNILTLHGACPVVTGSKWVTNVWFHERGQEFRLKCGKYPDSSLQPAEWPSRT